MKAECPNCAAVYQIDDSKIPDKGAYTTCKKCQTHFQIKKKPEEKSALQEGEPQQEIITCPNCGHVNISSDTCTSCGTVFSEDDKSSLTIKV